MRCDFQLNGNQHLIFCLSKLIAHTHEPSQNVQQPNVQWVKGVEEAFHAAAKLTVVKVHWDNGKKHQPLEVSREHTAEIKAGGQNCHCHDGQHLPVAVLP